MCECRTIARSPTSSGMADRQKIESLVEIAAPGDLEVRGGDGWDEPRVEGLRDPEGRVDAVPAEAQRHLMDPQLARMEDAQELDAREVGLEEGPVLGDRVLAQVPRVAGLLRPGRRKRAAVGRGHIGDGRRGGEAPQ